LDTYAGMCTMCHVPGVDTTPADHSGYSDDTCTTCHIVSAVPTTTTTVPPTTTTTLPSGTPPNITSHPVDSYEGMCTMCHISGSSMPSNHAGLTDNQCLTCHKAGTPPTTSTAAPPTTTTTLPSGTPPNITSHDSTSYAGMCTMCHVAGSSMPISHTGLTDNQCLTCIS
jgi:hypothetical protein